MEGKENSLKQEINVINNRREITQENLSGNNVLDFGCGYGLHIVDLAKYNKHIKFTGYDLNQERIKGAKGEAWRNNFDITSSKDELKKNAPFSDVVLSFVIEESGFEVLDEVDELLNKDGNLILFFYDIKDKDLNQLTFESAMEKKTFEEDGKEESLKKWSKYGQEDYINSLEEKGFTISKKGKLADSQNRFSYIIAKKD
jgi:2-polyprenyl-3-methyl-5-hydroxy-6-metoxy-1,4-benzoquinol methylase